VRNEAYLESRRKLTRSKAQEEAKEQGRGTPSSSKKNIVRENTQNQGTRYNNIWSPPRNPRGQKGWGEGSIKTQGGQKAKTEQVEIVAKCQPFVEGGRREKRVRERGFWIKKKKRSDERKKGGQLRGDRTKFTFWTGKLEGEKSGQKT